MTSAPVVESKDTHPNWKSNLTILWMVQVLSQTAFGFGLPFMSFYIQDLGVTSPDEIKLWTGLLSMAPALTMALFSPVWGRLADRLGSKPMVLRASFAASIVLALMGLAPNVWVLLIMRVLQGIFTGTIVAANTFVARNTPAENMGSALGFLSSAQFIGASLGPALGGFVADSVGYRVSFFLGGLASLIGGVIAMFFLKEKPHKPRDKKEEADSKAAELTFSDAWRVAGLILLVLMLSRFSRSLIAPFIPLHLEELRGSDGILRVTGTFSMAISLLTALAGLTLPRLGKRFKNRFTTVLYALGAVCIIGILLFPGFWTFVILYGLMSYFVGGVEPLMTAELTEKVSEEHRGALFGYNALTANLGWFLAPIAGSAVSIAYGIASIFYIMLASYMVSMFLVTRNWKKKQTSVVSVEV